MGIEYSIEVQEQLNRFLSEYLKYRPEIASELGLHEYDYSIPDFSKESILNYTNFLKKWLEKLNNVDKTKLTTYVLINYELVKSFIEKELIFYDNWSLWKMKPIGVYTFQYLIFPFIIRDHLPIEYRLNILKLRLKNIDKIILNSIYAIEEPYEIWIKLSIQICKGLVDQLNSLKNKFSDHELNELIDKGLERINYTIDRLNDLLQKSKPGFKPIGRELFIKLLKCQFIDEDIEYLRKVSYEEAEKYRKLMLDIVKKLNYNDIKTFLENEYRRKIIQENIIEKVKELVNSIRKFLVGKSLINIPEFENVKIIETPEFAKPYLPFGAYIPPELFSWDNTGILLITVDSNKWTLPDLINLIIHELYPGHHTQLIYHKGVIDPVRKIFGYEVTDFIEGWAHYCEELVLESCFSNDLYYRFKVYHDALWRAVRVYVDIELSTGIIGFNQAVSKMVNEAYLEYRDAYSEVIRYTFTPGYQLCYWYGKYRIKCLKEKVKSILGDRFDNRVFHKLLLEEGSLPIEFIERILLSRVESLIKS